MGYPITAWLLIIGLPFVIWWMLTHGDERGEM